MPDNEPAGTPSTPAPLGEQPEQPVDPAQGAGADSPIDTTVVPRLAEGKAGGSTAKRKTKQQRSFLRELPFLVIVAFGLALLIKFFLVQAFFIPSGSMEQTLEINDRVLVNKVVYDYRDPHRGEIVVFNGLDNFDEGVTIAPPSNGVQKVARKVSGFLGLGTADEKDYIKRVIAVAGDRVMCCDAQGRVVVVEPNGTQLHLDEPYVYEPDVSDSRYFCEAVVTEPESSDKKGLCPAGATGILVPKGRLWVMGDHRSDSADSRFHVSDSHQGTVPVDKVVGRAFTVVYPLGHAKLLHVPHTFASAAAAPGAPYVGAVGLLLPVRLAQRRRRRRRRS